MKKPEKVFEISFNKCGTRALTQRMMSHGFPSAHWCRGVLASDIRDSFEAKRTPLRDFSEIVFFSDMVLNTRHELIQGNRI